MSQIKEIIEIHPPSGMYWPNSRNEQIRSKIYRCPVCNGEGGRYIDGRSFSYDPKQGEHYEPCVLCKGTGEIQCNVNIEWVAIGEIKEQFKTKNNEEKNSI